MICRWGWHRWRTVDVKFSLTLGTFVYVQDCRCGKRREGFWT